MTQWRLFENIFFDCTHVGSLLKSLGMENIWDEQKLLVSVDNFKQLKAGFKNELENCYAQKWIKEINDLDRHPILRTYIGFKNKFCQEKYIERLNIKNINEQYPASGSVLI